MQHVRVPQATGRSQEASSLQALGHSPSVDIRRYQKAAPKLLIRQVCPYQRLAVPRDRGQDFKTELGDFPSSVPYMAPPGSQRQPTSSVSSKTPTFGADPTPRVSPSCPRTWLQLAARPQSVGERAYTVHPVVTS
ncbi:hypothetical protein HOLleu_04711 [Holothuria leucospilota]|uniref:Uncharacterized protein n=1 Tax=Holothuria leucospilota TaxID=206669 RepID=A0A9Q1HIJ7_HOLLE|nr:hypothetical protein HOLleu_04711 [Holothuria leucospilota]